MRAMKSLRFETKIKKDFIEYMKRVSYVALKIRRNLLREIKRCGKTYEIRVTRTIRSCLISLIQPVIEERQL